ncbi:AfsR/SARP family transcriptional regulator, partial [Knoellia sinensis]
METRVEGCRVSLLGGWGLAEHDRPVHLGLREERVMALLALRGHQSRAATAATLWPDSAEPQGRANLRTALKRLRGFGTDLVTSVRNDLVLGPGVHVDVWELHDCLDTIERGSGSNGLKPTDVLSLLRRPDLLPDWYEDWVLFERERLHLRRIRALEDMGRRLLNDGDASLAIRFAEEALLLEPLLESGTRLLIEAHLAEGNRSSAVHTFQRYRHRLESELGITPSRVMSELLTSRSERRAYR